MAEKKTKKTSIKGKASGSKVKGKQKPAKTAAKKPSKPKKAVKSAKVVKPKKIAGKKAPVAMKTKASPKKASSGKTETARERKLQTIKLKLVSQRDSLLSEAETAMNVLPDQTVFPDLGDQASVEVDRNFMLRLRGREQRLLKKIDDAIERIDNGNYGICESCGEFISLKRLEARPVTTMCIACKTEQEEEEKLKGL